MCSPCRILAASVLFLLALASWGADEAPLFGSTEPFKAVLTAPILQAYSQKDKDKRLYLEGTWTYKDAEDSLKLPVKIRTRGNNRRKICKLPPLQLNFRKSELEGTLLDGQNKLKMVSPCKSGNKYQQLIILEYLVYQFYALVSDYHFRSRLVEVNYVDSSGKEKAWNSVNFLLEDEQDMARRVGMESLDITASRRSSMDLSQTALLEVFQWVIGNVDYSTLKAAPGESCCHNVKLIAPEGATDKLIPVAYDFDSSGIINAPYAAPPQGVPVKKVTQRYFMGWCKEEKQFRRAIDRLNRYRDEAIALFSESPLLDSHYRKKAVSYLEKSYKLLEDESSIHRNIFQRCRGEVIKG